MATAYGTKGRSLKRQKLLAFAMLGTVALAMAGWIIWAVSAKPMRNRFGVVVQNGNSPSIKGLVAICLIAALVGVTYHVLPNVRLKWRQSLPGAITALAGAILLSAIWPIYSHFAGQTLSTHAVFFLLVVVVTYVYLLAEIVAMGIALNGVIYQRSKETT